MTFGEQLICFRADASLRLGVGHVTRCLTLADELRRHGAVCQFICREQPGDLIQEITARGYSVRSLTALPEDMEVCIDERRDRQEDYERRDAEETCATLDRAPSIVVVDHYSLGYQWETRICTTGVRVISIDDLANREHDCHLLVDQNLGRSEDDYRRFVPAKCQILTGPRFALLRSEFAEWRTFSLQRRASARLRRLFISMGGFDHSDVTSQVLAALQNAPLSPDSQITVALGRGSPWSDHVRSEVDRLPWATEVVVGAPRIAEIMANSDLAIGAAGGTAWERCCLGLPTLIVAVAENQRLGANALVGANAAYGLGGSLELADSIPQALRTMSHPERLHEMSLAASRLVDGLGAGRVGRHLGHLIGCAYAN